jgi:DNA repair photolyase
MPVRKSKGNMYEWVSHTWSPLVGCGHQCSYCYVRKYKNLPETPVLKEDDFPDLGMGRTIFVGHMTDMFCDAARAEDVQRVLAHTVKFPLNIYVFQTKNLQRLMAMGATNQLPEWRIIGTTVETNRADVLAKLSKAPPPLHRTQWLASIPSRTFLTVEPILDFDVDEFTQMIAATHPEFINIGADSKGHGLPEPSREKLLAFIDALGRAGVKIHKKVNLARILEG